MIFTVKPLAAPLIALNENVLLLFVLTSSFALPFTLVMVTVSVLEPLAAVSCGRLIAAVWLVLSDPVQGIEFVAPPLSW